MKYPEHEKLSKVQEQSQVIGDFLEWLHFQKGIILAEWVHVGKPEPGGYDELHRALLRKEQLLAEFFEIDLSKIEKEKRQMLEELNQEYTMKQQMEWVTKSEK